jgi:rifampicin phosphotransferase
MEEHRLIIELNAIRENDMALVGPKAMSLARLGRMGLAAPSGFCVTTAAFSSHVDAECAATVDGDGVLGDIRDRICQVEVSEKLTALIAQHYKRIGSGAVAVRSSATAEDLPGHSFAGQYDTFLSVTGPEACVEAVKKCWAALWTQRAYEYRQSHGFEDGKVGMGVIVQRQIEPDAAGVVFTLDPVTGSRSRMVIEACAGLGERLVLGHVDPDRIVLRKKNLSLVRQTVPGDEKREPVLGLKSAKRLARLARRIERDFGRPQDIEWAIQNGKLWFLQARPITATPEPKSWADRQVWTNANTGEVLPDVVTPLTWSIVESLFSRAIDQAFTLFCTKLGDHRLFDRVAGRIYFNINTCLGVLKCFPVLRNLDFQAVFGGKQSHMVDLGQLDLPDEDIPHLKFGLGRMLLKTPGVIFRVLTYTPRKAEPMVAEIKNHLARLQSRDIAGMSVEELAESFTADVSRFDAFLAEPRIRYGVLYSVVGFASLQTLGTLCPRWFGSEGGSIANRLLAAMGGMDDAEAGLDLWRLAQKAHETSDVEKIVLDECPWDKTARKLFETAGAEVFLKEWDVFMARHGHHCRGELELGNARWSEEPDYILSIMRNYLGGLGRADPLANYSRYAEERQEIVRLCRRRLKNPIKRVIFNRLLARAQEFSLGRENTKSDLTRITGLWRKMLLELGRRLRESDTLSAAEDIFFVKMEEIVPVVRGQAQFDVRQVVAQRRAEYERNTSVVPPMVVFGQFDPDTVAPELVDPDVELFNGLAVSSGVATGKARVILRADTDQQVSPGEILVAPFTDPGWTPYFIPAAGIIMDQGGILSHGAIIAREYGIPAVVNVGPATKIIKTGQTVQVDGNRGIVRILS